MSRLPALMLFPAAVLATLLFSGPAEAYVGPGAGLGALAAVLALLVGVVLLVIGFLWYPLRRMLRNRRSAAQSTAQSAARSTAAHDRDRH